MAVDTSDSFDALGRLDAIVRGLADPSQTEMLPVRVGGIPAAPVLAVERYLVDLSRELAVIRLGATRSVEEEQTLAEGVFSTMDVIMALFRPFRRQVVTSAEAARAENREVFEIDVELPAIAQEAALLFGDLLAQMALAGGDAGLNTATLGEVAVQVFNWFLEAVVHRLRGEEPVPYAGPTEPFAELVEWAPERRGERSVLLDALHDSRSFPLALESPRAARHFVAGTLLDWGLTEHAERSTLPVSELVTNVIVHAHTQAVVQVMSASGKTRVGVRDFSIDQPMTRDREPRAPFGRGLRIVDQSVSRWGVDPDPSGKSVWFELDAAGA
jgi:anti-sigma regulatory factor (Ser/Thr protein kinase)